MKTTTTAKTTTRTGLPAACAGNLAREMIAQGVITNPRFIRALNIQQELLKHTGTYRLLVEIMADTDGAGTYTPITPAA